MKNKPILKQFICVVSSTLLSVNAVSAPGIIQDVPLNVSTVVQPNILFLLDDSGSMDWEVLKSNSAEIAIPTIVRAATSTVANLNACLAPDFAFGGVDPLTFDFEIYASEGNIDFTPNGEDSFLATINFGVTQRDCLFEWDDPATEVELGRAEVLELCRGYNATAFDPDVAAAGGYTPWIGDDNTGTPYDDRPLNNALLNPYFGEVTGNIGNLNAHFYIPWNDDGDGEYDPGECPDDFQDLDRNGDGTLTLEDCEAIDDTTVCQPVRDLEPVVIEETIGENEVTTSIDIQEQYANWFSYYRKREYVAKRAVSQIIDESQFRLGMATLHNNSVDEQGVGTIIQDMRIPNNKNTLLDSLFRTDSAFGTPLRQNSAQVGEYFREGGTGDGGSIGDLFGFTPAHTGTLNATTPILSDADGGSCQKNFSVVFSDGFWNGGALNAQTEARIGNADGDDNTDFDGGSFADTASITLPYTSETTLADIAMHYYENDLSPGGGGLRNDLNVNDPHQIEVPINHQHLVTYTLAFGVDGTIANDAAPNAADTTFAWPDPFPDANNPEKIDDMRHAAWNGRGQYLNAGDPQSLIEDFITAISDIGDRVGTASAAAISSGFISAETLVFQSTFNTSNWSGDLLAYRFDENGVIDLSGNGIIGEDDAIWSASANLTSLSDSQRIERNIYTFNGIQGVPFDFPVDMVDLADPEDTFSSGLYRLLLNGTFTDRDSLLSNEQIAGLLSNAPHPLLTTVESEISANEQFGIALVNYLKGDPSNELGSGSSLFRNRDENYLGAIINSSPQYVGPPNDLYPNLIESNAPYNNFKTGTTASRTPAVYVGGNDGMLHAFDASLGLNEDGDVTVPDSAGNEIFAYIPGTLLENELHTLAETDYEHLAYVDASPTIRDIFDGSNWRTFLVGAVRSGGRGVYILDVTNPSGFSASNVLAEFSHPELGYTFSRPQIVKMNNDRWAAVFGNGYNSAGCDSDGNNCGTAKLFILYLDSLPSAGSPFEEGTHFEIIRAGAATVANGDCLDPGSDCNGLSSPTVADLNGDFITDRIYAGDLHGNMWVFDVTDTNSNNWGIAFGGSTPLFTACTDITNCTATRQPITVKPEISLHPTRRSFSTAPNVLVYFGTGQYIAEGDAETTDTQTFYAVWDAGHSFGGLDRASLQLQSFSVANGDPVTVTNNTVDYAVSGSNLSGAGWYIDLEITGGGGLGDPFEGARAVINPLLSGRVIFFLVSVPSGEACNRDGESYLVALDAYDGTQADFNIFGPGPDGSPANSNPVTLLDTPAVGLGIAGSDPNLVITGSDGSIGVEDITDGITVPAGRKSWSILR